MSKKLGYVQWFDESGEGMLFCPETLKSLYIHYSAIKTDDEFKILKKHQPVEFTTYKNIYMEQVDSVWPSKFNQTIENEHKLNRLMNDLYEIGDTFAFDLTKQYYGEN